MFLTLVVEIKLHSSRKYEGPLNFSLKYLHYAVIFVRGSSKKIVLLLTKGIATSDVFEDLLASNVDPQSQTASNKTEFIRNYSSVSYVLAYISNRYDS